MLIDIDIKPRQIDEMIGQSVTRKDIKNRSKDWNFPQAIFLEGETGSGKTTLACIIAALLNCHSPVTMKDGHKEPCLKCPSCLDIMDEKFSRDVSLLDASAMDKGAVVNLQSAVSIYSRFDKNRILIIDEAQALSSASKGATLKLLENKLYKNVYFILCTMDEFEKKDKPVNSRCQTYKFKPIDHMDIAKYMYNEFIKKQNIEVPEEFINSGIFTIAEAAEGSVRQALKFLSKCIYSEIYTDEEIMEEIGYISNSKMIEFLYALLDKDKDFFKLINKVPMDEFYYYSFAILVDAMKYATTEYVSAEWKIKPYRIMLEKPFFTRLFQKYQIFSAQHTAYSVKFNQAYFESLLTNYYAVPEIPIRPQKVLPQRKVKRIPV